MRVSRLSVGLSLFLAALFSLSCQSRSGSFPWRPGQQFSSSAPASPSGSSDPDDSANGSAASLSQTAVAAPAASAGEGESEADKAALSPQQGRHPGGSRGPFSEAMDFGFGRNDGTEASASSASPVVSAETSVLNQAFGLLGLPGLGGSENESDKLSVYELARTTYGSNADIYNWNPDGSYGRQSSSLVQFNPGSLSERLLQQAVSAGSGAMTSWAEGWLGGYGKARLNLSLNLEGHVTGSCDFLLPLYDTEGTTVFSQLGLRTMSGDRVIGNFGLGQRFFLSENLAVGYNGFLDYDFTRTHSRGGVGLEGWYD
jgi:hypothetical protein